jgi:hypothetical protein
VCHCSFLHLQDAGFCQETKLREWGYKTADQKTILLYLSKKRTVKKINLFLLGIFCLFAIKSGAQDNPSHLRISLLTCGPGEELYSTFGHTAIRIIDSSRATDIVYNFGTFDFNDPDFYMKFTRGKLDYFLSVSSMPDFMYEYEVEKRPVTEQVLLLNDTSKTAIANALTATLSSPARYYKYDFLYNNCTSRVRDIFIRYAGLQTGTALVPAGTTFRNMLHEYLNKGDEAWSKFGIDLLLGSPIDKPVNIPESMFLPDYLMKGIDSSAQQNHAGILEQKKQILAGNGTIKIFHNWPLYLYTAIVILLTIISLLKNKTARLLTKGIDFLLLFKTGLLGIFLLFMWFGTDHKACAANYNLLWAIPTNIVAAFALWKKPKWLQTYFSLTAFIHAFTLICWLWLPQQLNNALVPVVIYLLYRSVQLRKN